MKLDICKYRISYSIVVIVVCVLLVSCNNNRNLSMLSSEDNIHTWKNGAIKVNDEKKVNGYEQQNIKSPLDILGETEVLPKVLCQEILSFAGPYSWFLDPLIKNQINHIKIESKIYPYKNGWAINYDGL